MTETLSQKIERVEKENAALAKQIGLTIPPKVLARAVQAAVTKEPHPSEYGLDEEVMKFFSSMPRTWGILPSILGWVSCFGSISFLLILIHQFFLLFWLPFWFLSFPPARWAAGKLKELHFENSKKKHRLYRNWQAYSAAHSEWQRIHFKELAAEGARQALLVKQRAEEQRRQLNWWKSLNGKQFEKELAGLLRQLGYDVSLTPYSRDGGVDIFIMKGTKHIVVQCKAHNNYISPGVVRELYGTMIHQKAEEGWIVTTSGFHAGAREFAHGKPLKLITINELLNRRSKEVR